MEQPKEPPKELPLDQQVGRAHKDVVSLSKKLRISREETIMLLMQRELVFLNAELRRVHEMTDLLLKDTREMLDLLREMLDLLRGKKAKGKGKR